MCLIIDCHDVKQNELEGTIEDNGASGNSESGGASAAGAPSNGGNSASGLPDQVRIRVILLACCFEFLFALLRFVDIS
jgi:hypothetical protein